MAKSSSDAYSVELTPPASHALMRLPLATFAQLQRRLSEIAEIAGTLASVFADGVGSTLRLEISGHVVSYVISDAHRALTVLSIVPATPDESLTVATGRMSW